MSGSEFVATDLPADDGNKRQRTDGSSSSLPSRTILHLPSSLLTSSILPFLNARLKISTLQHISRSFPPLTPSSFQHDHILFHWAALDPPPTVGSYWYRYCHLVSTCHSLEVGRWAGATDARGQAAMETGRRFLSVL